MDWTHKRRHFYASCGYWKQGQGVRKIRHKQQQEENDYWLCQSPKNSYIHRYGIVPPSEKKDFKEKTLVCYNGSYMKIGSVVWEFSHKQTHTKIHI